MTLTTQPRLVLLLHVSTAISLFTFSTSHGMLRGDLYLLLLIQASLNLLRQSRGIVVRFILQVIVQHPRTSFLTTKFQDLTHFKFFLKWRKESEVQPVTCHEGAQSELWYNYSFLNLCARSGGVAVSSTPRPLYPREWPGTLCISV